MWIFYHFNFERNYGVLNSKSRCILLNKSINFKMKSEMENPTHSFTETNLVHHFVSYKNRKLKVKLRWLGARERKKRAFFIKFISFVFFDQCILSQCILDWIHFQNIHTFTHQKTLLHTLFCLFLKSSKARKYILKDIIRAYFCYRHTLF